MKLGFSTLALFGKEIREMFKIANSDNFQIIEILCEGYYLPRYLLNELVTVEKIKEKSMFYDLKIFLHGSAIDLNPGSMNEGIRHESEIQIKETLYLAYKLDAIAITIHSGIVHRKKRIRDIAMNYAIDCLSKCQKYAEDLGVILSIENLPNNHDKFLGNTPEELKRIVTEVGSSTTIDWGHANTYEYPMDYLTLPNINYFHLNDNNGAKDQHLTVGEGNAIFNKKFLSNVEYGIIELNNYENVLKSQKFMNNLLI